MVERLVEALPLIFQGIMNTLYVSVVSMIISIPVALLIGLLRISRSKFRRTVANIYIEFWRGVPFIIELLIVYFALPVALRRYMGITIDISAFEAMVVGCFFWTSANLAEVLRGAISTIPYGQTEAATALGMSYFQRMHLVILPQALKATIAPGIGIYTLMLKGTAIGFIVEYREIIRMGQITIERLFMEGEKYASFEIYSLIMVIYFVIIFPLSKISQKIEARLLINP